MSTDMLLLLMNVVCLRVCVTDLYMCGHSLVCILWVMFVCVCEFFGSVFGSENAQTD